MRSKSFFQRAAVLLVIVFNLGVTLSQTVPGNRIYSGDSSCICGIDSALLERLQDILRTLPAQSCPAPTPISSWDHEQTGGLLGSAKPSTSNPSTPSSNPSSQVQHERPEAENHHEVDSKARPTMPSQAISTSVHQGSSDWQQHQIHQVQVGSTANSDDARHPIRPNENQADLSAAPISARPTVSQPTESSQGATPRPSHQEETQVSSPPPSNPESSESSQRDNGGPTNSGFLSGLTSSSHNQALAKLNQSSQSINENDMTSALESTVPNLVSNIFSNIKNLTIQTEQNPDRPQSDTLTSIDGSSVDVHGDSKDQITAGGEKLFDIWLEHQIATLNLTAAMAGHIRKSAGILFRRIIKQYVERVEKMGGKVEQNIQRATQMALNNTQILIAFLLKNYVNFAAGIMQILGEQVSRVGKQIDSTGDTIAHMSLNPFDIISNVMESLPNPSDYSNYFRNFGKQLLGDVVAFSNGVSGSSGGGSGQNQQSSGSPSGSTPQNNGGLITKTIGAITKFGSWFG